MYLIIGGNGFLGSYIIKNILEHTEDIVIATARDISACKTDDQVRWVKCEVTNDNDIDHLVEAVSLYKDIKVVYLAAYHKPDLVQKNPRIAWNINITALSKILNKLDNVNCLFYASTDSVYGSSVGDYHFKEEDNLKPENIYGMQKRTAEAVVTGYGYNVVRYPFLIGTSLLQKKKHFYDDIVSQISSGKEFGMFMDSYRSSLDFNTAAYLLIQLMETYKENYPKVLNIAGDDDLSKYDVGLMVAEKTGCDPDLIKPIRLEDNNDIFTAPRATSTLMDNSKVKNVLGIKEIKLNL